MNQLTPFGSGLRDRWPQAEYRDTGIPLYAGNPFVEALPPIVNRDAASDALQRMFAFDPGDRTKPAELRMHQVTHLRYLVQPLGPHLELFDRTSTLLRTGYIGRNPVRPSFFRGLLGGVKAITSGYEAPPDGSGDALGMAILGLSGVGKTTAIRTVLSCYPQVITHSQYKGVPFIWQQIVWLRLDCPHDASIKGLCLSFFRSVDRLLGTGYEQMYGRKGSNIDALVGDMARVAALHGLGMLVIDEMQNLNQAKSGGAQKMLNFFVQLMNELTVPVIMIGTSAMNDLLGGDFRQARRSSGLGSFNFGPVRKGKEFDFFCGAFWDYQYLREPAPYCDEMSSMLYDMTYGVADLIVKMFILSQLRALALGRERLTKGIFESVYRDCFSLLHRFIEALRAGKPNAERDFDQALARIEWRDLTLNAIGSGGGVSQEESGSSESSSGEAETLNGARGIKKRRAARARSDSHCELVRLGAEAVAAGKSVHDLLVERGYTKNFGMEEMI